MTARPVDFDSEHDELQQMVVTIVQRMRVLGFSDEEISEWMNEAVFQAWVKLDEVMG